MALALFVYMIGFFHGLGTSMTIFMVLSAMSVLFLGINMDSSNEKAFLIYIKKCTIGFVIATCGVVLIPTEKTMWMMAAGYAAQNVYESESGNRVRKIINLKLDQYVDELVKETVKSSTK